MRKVKTQNTALSAKNVMAKKAMSTVMAVAMLVGGMVPAMAGSVDIAGGTGNAEAILNAQAAIFDVTVPMQLPITVDGNGVVSTATDAKITNNSCGSVIISGVTFDVVEGWTGVAYDKDMSAVKVGSKEIGFKLNGGATDATGAYGFLAENFPSIAAANDADTDDLALVYDAVLPAQRDAITEAKVADVVFTIGWDVVEDAVV